MHDDVRRLLRVVPDPLLRHLMYRRRFGRWGNFSSPSRFSEFLVRRLLQDRDDRFAWTCDKLRMKAFAARRCPNLMVPQTLWHGRDVSELPVSELPERWVLKPNHSSKRVFMGDRSTTTDELHEATAGWLKVYDRHAVGEWAYGEAERTLIVEQHLGGGNSIDDFKFFVFHGRALLIEHMSGRFTDDDGERFYTRDWRSLDISNCGPLHPPGPAPEGLEEMIAAAEELGRDFDFMRVDLYQVDGRIWFGELTPYPSGGMDPFEPESFDILLGAWWAGVDDVPTIARDLVDDGVLTGGGGRL
ncbi:ATP-grasp fold amidoligase family protein [Nesterenkonia marinintestina]|uniref:ATP-grasp fold amidoligase family protein n=1 Tax=Nesterenkonia marinintestina TaxID=2979865 RepID=UPI0021C0FC38|nr:ATP-grasp fold amidoligase family protein [Nesterenkonia sp. GX14115]